MKKERNFSKVYWKILDSYINLHPYLTITISKHGNRVIVRFSELNENGERKLVAVGSGKSIAQAIVKASEDYPKKQDKSCKKISYQMETTRKFQIPKSMDLSSLILKKKCYIEITAYKNFMKEVEKTVKIITSRKSRRKKFKGRAEKCEQIASGHKALLDLIIKVNKSRKKRI